VEESRRSSFLIWEILPTRRGLAGTRSGVVWQSKLAIDFFVCKSAPPAAAD
jgi:hypothetical protein